MGPKCVSSENFSLFIVKFKKLKFSASLRVERETLCTRGLQLYVIETKNIHIIVG